MRRLGAVIAALALVAGACGSSATPNPVPSVESTASGSEVPTSPSVSTSESPSGSPTAQGSTAPSTAAPYGYAAISPFPTQPVTITLWTQPGEVALPGFETHSKNPGDWDRYLAAQYTALHPNVHFVVQDFAGGSEFVAKIDAALQAGQPPDILNWTDGLNSGFAHTSGVLEDLSKIAPTASAALLPAYKKLYTVNGSLFLMPTYASIYNFVKVNKAMFDAAGLTLPADGNWTYDEFNADMAKLAVPGKVWPVAIRLTDWVTTYDWQGFLWGYGCEPWNSTLTVSTINSPACLQALQWLIDANNKGWIEPGAATIDYGPEDTLFNTCAVAISYGRANAVQRQQGMAAQTTCPMDVQIEQWPHLASAPPVAPSVSTDGWSVFTQADPVKKQVIGDFIDFAFQPQYSMPYAIQQSSPSLYTSWPNPLVSNPDLLKADTWIAQQGVFNDGVLGPNYLQIRQQTAPIWQSAFLGQTSPQDALSQIDTKINILLTTPSQ